MSDNYRTYPNPLPITDGESEPVLPQVESLDEIKERFEYGEVWIVIPFEGRMKDEALALAKTLQETMMVKEFAVVES